MLHGPRQTAYSCHVTSGSRWTNEINYRLYESPGKLHVLLSWDMWRDYIYIYIYTHTHTHTHIHTHTYIHTRTRAHTHTHTRAALKISDHFEYLANRSRGLDVTLLCSREQSLSRGASQSAVRHRWVSLCTVWPSHSHISSLSTAILALAKAGGRRELTDLGDVMLCPPPQKKACTRAVEWAGALSWWSWSAHSVIVNTTVTQYTSSVNGVSLPTDQPHGRVTIHGRTVRSSLTGCQVTSRPRDRFSRYSKWSDTFRTALAYISNAFCMGLLKKNREKASAGFSTDDGRS